MAQGGHALPALSLLLLWPLGGTPLHPLSDGGDRSGSVVVAEPVDGGTPPSLSLLDLAQRPSLHYLLDLVPWAMGVALLLDIYVNSSYEGG